MEIYVKAGSKTMMKCFLVIGLLLASCSDLYIEINREFDQKYLIEGFIGNKERLALSIYKLNNMREMQGMNRLSSEESVFDYVKYISDTIALPIHLSITTSEGERFDTSIWEFPANYGIVYYNLSGLGPKGQPGMGYKIELGIEDKNITQFVQIPDLVKIDDAVWAEQDGNEAKRVYLLPKLPLPDFPDTVFFSCLCGELTIGEYFIPNHDYFLYSIPQDHKMVATIGYIDLYHAMGWQVGGLTKKNSDAMTAYARQFIGAGTHLRYFFSDDYRDIIKFEKATRYNNSGPVAAPLPYPHMAGQDQDVYGYIVGIGSTYIEFDL
jgi:hypothetical protein